MPIEALALVAVAFTVLLAFTKRLLGSHASPGLPPGPTRLPLIGNLLQLPKVYEWITYKEWADIYGDVISITILGQPIIILNSMQAVGDIIEKKAVSSAGRPQTVFACKLAGYGPSAAITNDMELHKKYRRIFAQALSNRAAQEYWPIHWQETRRMMTRLLSTPADLDEHIKRTVGAIVFLVVYGYQIEGNDDAFLRLARKNNENFLKTFTPGAYLVDILPFLRFLPSWFPGAGFHKEAAIFREELKDLLHRPFNLAAGTARPCFTTNLLEPEGKPIEDPEEEDRIMWVAALLFGAGADSSTAALYSFYLAMTLYPEVQAKAQAEIDEVVGKDRMPTSEDKDLLVYCSAICHEVLRWQPIGPLGLPRLMLQDEEYEGHFLPKDSIVLMNLWAVLRDPKVYPEPERFRPERFLTADGKQLQNPEGARDFSAASFGFGRRLCPGSHLAEGIIFATVVNTLWAFNIGKAIDAVGKPVEPGLDYESGFVHRPKRFSCMITPRSEQVIEILRDVTE